MSDPRKTFVGCPSCKSLLRVWKSEDEAQCPFCDVIFNPQKGEILERRDTHARRTITQRPLRTR